MPLCPVVACARLSEDKVVRPEDLAIGSGSYGIHGAWLEVDEHGPGHVLAAGRLIVVDVNAFQLQVGVARVSAGRVDAMLVRDDLPELKHQHA